MDFAKGPESSYGKGPNCIQAYMQSPRAFYYPDILNNAFGYSRAATSENRNFQTLSLLLICQLFRFSILRCETSFDISSRPMQKLSGASLKDICGLEIRYFQLSTFCRESFQKFFSPFGDSFLSSRIHKEQLPLVRAS